jgi:DNA-binding transcriptional MerR regulator
MHIGEIARQACVSRSLLRYYEEIGLIPSPGRDLSGYRSYSEVDLARIRLISGARAVGLSVCDIRELLLMQDRGEAPCCHLLELLDRKAREVARRMDRLQGLEAELRRLRDLGLSLCDHKDGRGPCPFHTT